MTFYEKINGQVTGDADSADQFVDIIILSLYETLKEELVSNFESHMYQVETEPDLGKEPIVLKSNKRFQEAEDMQTIIEHMRTPVELEKKIFEEEYLKSQRNYAKDLIEKFDKQVISGM